MKLNITIEKQSEGVRLDAFISDASPSCSRRQAVNLANSGEILVNNTQKKAAYRLKAGDIVSGTIPELSEKLNIKPQNIDLDIVYEDKYIIVINKTPGIVVHPGSGNSSGTLVNALLYYDKDIGSNFSEPLRPGIVHRLDKDTSGLMVIARTRPASDFLQKEFKQRRVEKRYLTLVQGCIEEDHGEINLPIGRHPVNRKIMAVRPETGKEAATLWSVRKRYKTASFLEILLKTGRTHQIRVHFYAINHPLIGDKVYQPKRFRKKGSKAPRQMLHSHFLGFRHPYSGRKMEFKVEPPEDFLKVKSFLQSL